MVCGRCGKTFDEDLQDYCGFCRTVHTKDGKPVLELKDMLCYISERFGIKTLLDRRRTDALIADLFPKQTAQRRLAYVALYDGCAAKLLAVKDKPFEVRCAAAARCVKSLRDEIGLKGASAAAAVEAVGCAVGCAISFRKSEILPASATESKKNVTDAAEQYSLGRHFDRIHDYEKAIYWFECAALQDQPEAQYYMGCYRMEGRGGIQDIAQAREWFLRSAENGIAAADYMIGFFLAEGMACEQDENAAFSRFMKAARAGNPDAVNFIALCYENGVHTKKDPALAKKWRKFPENGVPEDAETESPAPLSDDGEELYQSARRCLADKDAQGAAMFYKRAAELGHIRAQCSYGKCLYLGSGVAKDEAEAFRQFTKAAQAGLDIAQYNLGVMFLKGVYVTKDLNEAKKYFQLAAQGGHTDAAKILKKLK